MGTMGEQDAASGALVLVEELCGQLDSAGISYCHWKSNEAIDRSASGENDLDLLISRSDITNFTEILSRLGFKQAKGPTEKQMSGVHDFFGFDAEADRIVHVHAHYQMVLGHDMTKNYRLPIEKAYIRSAAQAGLFKIPAVEYEYIVFIIRMVLKHSTWDTVLGGEGKLNSAERQELAYLLDKIDPRQVANILQEHLPYLSVEFLDECLQAITTTESIRKRIKIGARLHKHLRSNTRHSYLKDIHLKFWRRIKIALRRRILNKSPKHRLGGGGILIAVVGGDGAGKSTVVDGLNAWLSRYFGTTQVHMGKPDWSTTTVLVRGLLYFASLARLVPRASSARNALQQKALISPGYPWLVREICRSRDRFRTYVRARRYAADGGIVLLDRYPVPQLKFMDGPLSGIFLEQLATSPRANEFLSPKKESRLASAILKQEARYYNYMAPPDLLFVLRVEPDTAVMRKTDEDPATVRERSTEFFALDWQGTRAHVIDAGQEKEAVLAEIKSIIWSAL